MTIARKTLGRSKVLAVIVVIACIVGSSHASAKTISGTEAGDHLMGTNRGDKITAAANDNVFAKGGNDVITASGSAAHAIAPGGGKDRAESDASIPIVYDDDGRTTRDEKGDVIVTTRPSSAADIFSADGERDSVECGGASDFVFADEEDLVVGCETVITQTGPGLGGMYLFGTRRDDVIEGTDLADYAFGKNGKDVVIGAAGDDHLSGGRGKDRLVGGEGGDVLVDDDSGSGDVIDGGAGGDWIISADGGVDKISCGDDGDVVIADHKDVIKDDCEVVTVVTSAWL